MPLHVSAPLCGCELWSAGCCQAVPHLECPSYPPHGMSLSEDSETANSVRTPPMKVKRPKDLAAFVSKIAYSTGCPLKVELTTNLGAP